jgi:hypothetical protein
MTEFEAEVAIFFGGALASLNQIISRDSPDGRRTERKSASFWFRLQGEAVALADR